MATNTHIICACGSQLNTSNETLIINFDKVHGNSEHQLAAMKLKQEMTEVGKIKWGAKNGI